MRVAARLTKAAINHGISHFADFVMYVVDTVGKQNALNAAAYIEVIWERLGARPEFAHIDPAGKVSEVLAAAPESDPAPKKPKKPPQRDVAENLRLTVDGLREGYRWTPMQRYRRNVDAIRTLKQIEAEGRTRPTAAEQQILAGYSGWGSFPGVFNDLDPNAGAWTAQRDEVQALLTREEFESAQASTLNAHYTDPRVIDAIWQALQQAGFQPAGARAIETSAGIGYFLGLGPPQIGWSAVEYDSLTGRMLRMLYPQANVQVGPFQQFQAPDGYFDLAISNVPFAGTVILSDPRYKKLRPVLHDYFFLKGLDLVRPGGLVVFITSTGTLDKASAGVRRKLAENADLVTAIRLPAGAFQETAGTEVVTDLVVLRKRAEPREHTQGIDWVGTATVPDPDHGEDIPINGYYAAHPEQVLGTVDRKSKLYGRGQPHVSMTADFPQQWAAAMERLGASGAYQPPAHAQQEIAPVGLATTERPGTLLVREGQLLHVAAGGLMPIAPPKDHPTSAAATTRRRNEWKSRLEIVQAIEPLRQAYLAVLNGQLTGEPDHVRQENRRKLAGAYEAFVRKHGPVRGRKVRLALIRNDNQEFPGDDDYFGLASLELYDAEADKVLGRADIFTRDTIRGGDLDGKPTSLREAAGVVYNRRGMLDLTDLAALTGREIADLEQALPEEQAAYYDPQAGWQLADAYLAGNLRAKLRVAEQAMATDPRAAASAAAVRKLLPPDRQAEQIQPTMGAPWVPPETMLEFLASLVQVTPEQAGRYFVVRYAPSTGWVVTYTDRGEQALASTVATRETWGTADYDMLDLITYAIDSKPARVYDVDGLDQEATDAAMEKMEAIVEEYAAFLLYNDPARSKAMVDAYNDWLNNYGLRKVDGSHLTFPGMIPVGTKLSNGKPFQGLRQHQKDFTWQLILRGKGLGAHEVGTGKTMTMAAAAMEMRRLGLARKPAMVVPNSRIDATVAEVLELYPAARVLAAGRSMDSKGRKQTAAQISSGDWDVVVLTHENLKLLPVGEALRQEYFQEQIDSLRQLLIEEGVNPDASDKDLKRAGRGNRVVKLLVRKLNQLRERITAAASLARDSGVSFEETGIDFLFVDEAHVFKAAPINTRLSGIKGVPNSSSQAAMNLQMISRYLQRRQNGRGLALFTGTPITNTLAELAVMQNYVQGAELESLGLHSFDAWAASFGEISADFETTHTGEFREVVRFRRYMNLVDLKRLAFQDIDVVRVLDRPELNDALRRPIKHELEVVSEGSPRQQTYQLQLIERAKNLDPRDPASDNHLKISSDGAKATLDYRLIEPDGPEDPDSKVSRTAANIVRLLRERPGTTQLVFFEAGRAADAKGNVLFDVGEDLIAKLVAAGVPRDKVLDFRGVAMEKKGPMIARLKTGDAWVAIGNTKTLGTGVNVQDKLIAIHNLEPAWTPEAIEQRVGRIWRQGNTNPEIFVYTYLASGTLDKWKWETVARKHREIENFLSAKNLDQEEIAEEDLDSGFSSFDRFTALSTGDPEIFEEMVLTRDVDKLQKRQVRHDLLRRGLQRRIDAAEADLAVAKESLEKMTVDAATAETLLADEAWFSYTTPAGEGGGRTFSERTEATAAIRELWVDRLRYQAREKSRRGQTGGVSLGHVGPFELRVFGSSFVVGNAHSVIWNWALVNARGHAFSGGTLDEPEETTRRGAAKTAPDGTYLKDQAGNVLFEEETVQTDYGEFFRSVARALASFPKRLENHRLDNQKVAQNLKSLQSEQGRGFAGAVKLAEKEARLAAVRQSLAAKRGEQAEEAGESGPQGIEDVLREADEEARRREGQSGESMGFGMGALGGRNSRGSQAQSARVRPAPRPEVEQRIKNADGLPRPSLLSAFVSGLRALTRTYLEIPNLVRWASVREWFRLHAEVRRTAEDDAARLLAAIVDPLQGEQEGGPFELDLYTRIVILRNLAAAVERAEPLRFGFESLEEVQEYLAELEQDAANSPRVQRALTARKAAVRDLVGRLVDARLLPESALERAETYYHQQVLERFEAFKLPSGARVTRRGFRRGRAEGVSSLGPDADYNTNYLQAELSWLIDAHWSLAQKEHLEKLAAREDVQPVFAAEAKRLNFERLVGGPENVQRIEQLRAFIRAGVQAGLKGDELAPFREELAELDPTYPHRIQIARFASMLDRETGRQGRSDGEPDETRGEWLGRVRDLALSPDGTPGKIPALTILKWINLREKLIHDTLGEAYLTDRRLLAEDKSLAAWQPQPGNVHFKAMTLADQAVEAVLTAAGVKQLISAEDLAGNLRPVWVVGPERPSYFFPVEIAKQLDRMRKPPPGGPVGAAASWLVGWWKRYVLHGPLQIVAYTLRNMTGDLEPLILAAPTALRHVPRAMRELRGYHGILTRKEFTLRPSDELDLAKRLGVIASGFSGIDVPTTAEMEILERFDREPLGLVKGFKKYWSTVRRYSEFRENVFRYAAFLHYREASGKPIHYGGANRATVETIRSDWGNDEAAAHLSRNLLGDYGAVSAGGDALRQWAIPFYAWNEVNLMRWGRLVRNAFAYHARGRGLVRLATGGAAAAATLAIPRLLIELWNRLWAGDDDDELSEEQRSTAHLTLGRDSDGNVITWSGFSSSSDALEWFGANTLLARSDELASGQMDAGQVAGEMARDPIDKLWAGIGAPRQAFELATGERRFRYDEPAPTPRDELAAAIGGVEQPYREAKGRILETGRRARAGYWTPTKWLGGQVSDPREIAIREQYELIDRFLETQGEQRFGRGNPHFNTMKLAAAADDREAFGEAARRYAAEGGDFRKFEASLASVDPLRRLKESEHARYEAWLTAPQRRQLALARDHAGMLRSRLWTWWLAEQPHEARAELPKAIRSKVEAMLRDGQQEDSLRWLREHQVSPAEAWRAWYTPNRSPETLGKIRRALAPR